MYETIENSWWKSRPAIGLIDGKKYKDEDFLFNVLRIAKRNLGFLGKKSVG